MKQKIIDVLILYLEFGTLLRRRLTPRRAIGTIGAKAQKMLVHSSNSSQKHFSVTERAVWHRRTTMNAGGQQSYELR